jgi:hypothetical protein
VIVVGAKSRRWTLSSSDNGSQATSCDPHPNLVLERASDSALDCCARSFYRERERWKFQDSSADLAQIDEYNVNLVNDLELAEREGFEPSVEFPLHTLSKRAPSTTRTSLRVFTISCLRASG